MANRIIIEFICDNCGLIERVEQYSENMQGRIAVVHPYPKGWKTSEKDRSIDVCPKCKGMEVGTR